MADTLNTGGHPEMDYAQHEATYALFLRLLKFGTIGVICIVIVLAVLWG